MNKQDLSESVVFAKTDVMPRELILAGAFLTKACHGLAFASGWWNDLKTGESLLGKDANGKDKRNVPEMLCLIHSEVSEAMEGYRKNKMDDHLTDRKMIEVELADAIIRIFDLAGAHNMDLGAAIAEKLEYNARRADHKPENRSKEGGKSF
jgi:NTP pyrophosphatase (non-canonical NTP hydrolase)